MHKHFKAALAGLVTTFTFIGASSLPAQAVKPDPKQLVVNADTYSALGDSYAAGVGSSRAEAYPVLLAGKVNKVNFLAESGATTTDVLTEQVGQIPATTQQVTLTVGGNDLNFVETAEACLLDETACAGLATSLTTALQGISTRLALTIIAIEQQAPDAEIYVTGYPLLFQADPSDDNAWCVLGTTPTGPLAIPESRTFALDAATSALNTTIRTTVAGADAADGSPGEVTYVDVTDDFMGHGLCGTGLSPNPDSYIQPIHLTATGLDPTKPAALHPTAEGQEAYATAILDDGFENRALVKG